MKCPRPIGLVLVAMLSLVHSLPMETTTTKTTTSTRSTPAFGDTIKKVTNQLINANSTKLDMVFDTRTPPKVKQQVKLKEEMEHSHAGVAIPVDADTVDMDESTKKMNFYKLERPTTNSGLSTWILLSGQESSTVKPTTKRPAIKPLPQNTTKENVTVIVTDKPIRIIKPIFRKRTPSTPKPSTTTTVVTTTKVTTEPTKLTKIKASVLNNAVHKRNLTTTKVPTTTTTKLPTTTTTTTPTAVIKNVTVEATTAAANLTAEAKEGEVDLTKQDKKKKTTNKRRKNKPKRRKTANKTNSTSIAKPNKTLKQNAVSSQLYSYLAREIMPTVGVGLVGLMVTAGLASYFLYPFGAARRSSYDIDRKDKEGSYYYNDAYSGGIPEEEAIGKVIAGMPSNTLFPSNNYKSPAVKDAYPDSKYTLKDRRAQIRPQYYGDIIQGSVENIPVTPKQYNYQSNSFEPVTYTENQPSRYSPTLEQKFVVGNIPKEVAEEATPAVVPEHGPRTFSLEENMAEEPTYFFKGDANSTDIRKDYGPRSLKIRRKRSGISNEIEDEINTLHSNYEYTTVEYQTTDVEKETTVIPTSTMEPTSTTTTVGLPQKVSSFIDMMKELIQFKARLGLKIIQNITGGISKYISDVQSRMDQQFKNVTKLNN